MPPRRARRGVYGVVACPSCRQARAFEAGARTVACPRCGRRLDTAKLVTETAETVEAAQRLVGAVNARLARATPEEAALLVAPEEPERPPPDDALAALLRAVRAVSGEVPRADAAARALTASYGTFTEAQLVEAFEAAGLPAAKAAAHLKRMLASHVVFEPRAGRYAAL